MTLSLIFTSQSLTFRFEGHLPQFQALHFMVQELILMSKSITWKAQSLIVKVQMGT